MATPAGSSDPVADRIRLLERVRSRIDRKIEALQRQNGQPLAAPPAPSPPGLPHRPLKGLKLAVVGPSFREQDYREALAPLGAVVIFAASDEKRGRIYPACRKAHGIIFITSFTSHSAEQQAAAAAERRGCRMERLAQRGLDALKEIAVAMAGDMAAFKELQEEVRTRGRRPTMPW